MKKLISAIFLLSACVAQAENPITLDVENWSDHTIASGSIWVVADDGTVIDDPLGSLANLPGHAIAETHLSATRCFDHVRVMVTYDDGHEAQKDVDQCAETKIVFEYYP